ncbi:AraC family transcriptional regulator [Spirosoma endbachense]|nr:helix-turn-helix transcriptional regulator [Spirosoma endbachense]
MTKEGIQLYSLIESLTGVELIRIVDQPPIQQVEQKVIIPHRHDHYCCFFLEKGELAFSLDFQQFTIPSSSLLVSCPGQVHQLGSAKDVAGWFMAFEARFVDPKARMVIEQSFANVVLLDLSPEDQRWFAAIFELIQSTQAGTESQSFNPQLLQALINALFYKLVAVFQSQEDQRIQAHSLRRIEIVKTFRQLVQEQFLVLKKPADYAVRMNLTVSYLNDSLKSVTGFSSTYLIQHEVIREAQRLLIYTDKSVKEIAFVLGYNDTKYFIRLFGKTAGRSPITFRKANKL